MRPSSVESFLRVYSNKTTSSDHESGGMKKAPTSLLSQDGLSWLLACRSWYLGRFGGIGGIQPVAGTHPSSSKRSHTDLASGPASPASIERPT
jgi:hypothetical protein